MLWAATTITRRFIAGSPAILQRATVCVAWLWNHPKVVVTPLMRRSYGATTAVAVPMRRRRTKQAVEGHHHHHHHRHTPDNDDIMEESGENKPLGIRHEPVSDPEHFAQASAQLLTTLYEAIQPLQQVNDPLVLTRGVEESIGEFLMVDLGPVLGQYILQVDHDERMVILESPISGRILYVLSQSTNEWCGYDDGHNLIGLFVRDWIRQCKGVPKL